MAKKPETPSRIAENKKAAFNYFFEERHEAGIVLHGWEVKALRSGKAQISEGYVIIKEGELYLIGCQIQPLKTASTHVNPDAARIKKLLMKKDDEDEEIRKPEDQGQGRARQARRDQGPRRQARGRARDEEPQPLSRHTFK